MKMPDTGLPEGVETFFAETPADAAVALADSVAGFLGRRLSAAPRASLVVSGGSTPLPFFRALSRKALDWHRVDVLLADERWVPESDPASNTALVKENLLRNKAAEARFLALKQQGDTPEQGLAAVRRELKALVLPIDVLVLGMGNDGHTASLFPDAPELSEAMDRSNPELVSVMSPPSQAQRRITLNYAPLSEARFTALHLRGEDKLVTLRKAACEPENVLAMPVRGFLKPGLKVFWSP